MFVLQVYGNISLYSTQKLAYQNAAHWLNKNVIIPQEIKQELSFLLQREQHFEYCNRWNDYIDANMMMSDLEFRKVHIDNMPVNQSLV